MKHLLLSLALLLPALTSAACQSGEAAFYLLVKWLPGEYDNYEQARALYRTLMRRENRGEAGANVAGI